MKKTLIVTGGGTGGHLFAGISIADAWKNKFPDSRILFIGARGAIEERMVPKAGYPLDVLKLSALKSVSLRKRIVSLLRIPLSLFQSGRILIREKPYAVIGVGGYASGPVVLVSKIVGWIWGCRVAILEQNAVPGFTNKILGFFSNTVFCAFPGIEKHFNQKKCIVTGNPVRKEILFFESAPRSPFVIFIFGGSQGAMGINSLVLDFLKISPELKDLIEIIHQTGERDFERISADYKSLSFKVRVEKFIYDMPECYKKSSLVICRSGSSTLAEIATAGRAAILIPFPQAADNHQEKNARLFTDVGAALLLIQGTAQAEDLKKIILDLMASPDQIENMETRVHRFQKQDAADQIASILGA